MNNNLGIKIAVIVFFLGVALLQITFAEDLKKLRVTHKIAWVIFMMVAPSEGILFLMGMR